MDLDRDIKKLKEKVSDRQKEKAETTRKLTETKERISKIQSQIKELEGEMRKLETKDLHDLERQLRLINNQEASAMQEFNELDRQIRQQKK
jgi:predicted nuclease with TOPRIM domain